MSTIPSGRAARGWSFLLRSTRRFMWMTREKEVSAVRAEWSLAVFRQVSTFSALPVQAKKTTSELSKSERARASRLSRLNYVRSATPEVSRRPPREAAVAVRARVFCRESSLVQTVIPGLPKVSSSAAAAAVARSHSSVPAKRQASFHAPDVRTNFR